MSPKPARSQTRRGSATGSLPIRVTSLRYAPPQASLLAGALLLHATEQTAKQSGTDRMFLAGRDRLATRSTLSQRKELSDEENEPHTPTS
jgi:hypothetical protein